jgi:hypothetical protein
VARAGVAGGYEKKTSWMKAERGENKVGKLQVVG